LHKRINKNINTHKDYIIFGDEEKKPTQLLTFLNHKSQ
jgi:hypothetical protein